MIFAEEFNNRNLKIIFLLALLACIGVLLGRGWQHIFWDPPYRTLLWDENLLKPLVQKIFGMSWEQYVTNNTIDYNLQTSFKIIGVFLSLGAVFAIFINKLKRISVVYLLCCAAWLLLLAIIYWKEYFWDIPQFIELTSQWMAPVIFVALYKSFNRNIDILRILRITLALTFCGHGLYALGFVPLPGSWVDMVINAFSISETGAKHFLKTIGVLDILAAILVFIPKTERIGFWYMFLWGSIAALGRLVGTFYPEIGIFNFLYQQIGEFVYRFPQFLFPLMALFIIKESKRQRSQLNKTADY